LAQRIYFQDSSENELTNDKKDEKSIEKKDKDSREHKKECIIM